MTIYRLDYQVRYPYVANPSGYYYWTNQFYFAADNPTDYDLGRDEAVQASDFAHNTLVERSRFQVHRLDTGAMVQNLSMGNSNASGHIGTPLGLLNVIRFTLLAADGRKGSKTFRAPLCADEMDGGRLTSTAFDYYNLTQVNLWPASTLACLEDGTPIVGSVLSPLVHGWQLRHGTKRRAYVRLT